TVVNAKEVGLAQPNLPATTNSNDWGNTINVSSRESKTSTVSPWVQVRLPAQADLAGKTLRVKLNLHASCPQPMGNDKFHVVQQRYEEASEIGVGGPGAGGT